MDAKWTYTTPATTYHSLHYFSIMGKVSNANLMHGLDSGVVAKANIFTILYRRGCICREYFVFFMRIAACTVIYLLAMRYQNLLFLCTSLLE